MGDETAQTIRRFIETQLQAEGLSNDEDLVDAGYVNSLFAMQLVLFVEREFHISVQDGDLDLANFRSISAIREFVHRKQSSDSSAGQSDDSSRP